jgi:hypothetical protein
VPWHQCRKADATIARDAFTADAAQMTARAMRFAHDAAYVARLGAALYAYQSVEWIIIELLGGLRGDRDVHWAAGQTSGTIAKAFRDAVDKSDPHDIGRRWIQLTSVRDDIVHSRPATDPNGRQRLYRWAPSRRAPARFISDDVLDDFIRDLEAVSGDAESYRRRNTESKEGQSGRLDR